MPVPRSARPSGTRTRKADEYAPLIVREILASPYAYESADGFAERVGLHDRHEMNRILKRAGLPSYRRLASFARVMGILDAAVLHHRSLCAETIAEGYDPGWVYRTIRRETGRPWSDLRKLSHAEMLELVLSRDQNAEGQRSPLSP
jgi:hypothetical protein